MSNRTQWLAIALSCLLGLQAVETPGIAQGLPKSLSIVVLDGEGASGDPVVRVEDENRQPVSGAAVAFSLPTQGTSGVFANGSKTILTTTDPQGRAAARGLKVNGIGGELQIHVNASYRGLRSSTNITRLVKDVPGAGKRKSSKWIVILAVVGAGAAGGAIVAMRKGGNPATPANPTPPPAAPAVIVVTPGSGTVGPPQ
jgi:hypothetical protein